MDRLSGTLRKNEIEVIMAAQKLWYLVAYDVRDPKRLNRTAKHLKGYGTRLQYSIFRCRLSDRQVERLRWELAKILDKSDNLLIIGLCLKCAERIRKKGGSDDWTAETTSFEIV